MSFLKSDKVLVDKPVKEPVAPAGDNPKITERSKREPKSSVRLRNSSNIGKYAAKRDIPLIRDMY